MGNNMGPLILELQTWNILVIFYVFRTYVNEANIQFSSRVASLQVTPHVDVVVSDDASDQIRCGDALGPLGGHKHTWR